MVPSTEVACEPAPNTKALDVSALAFVVHVGHEIVPLATSGLGVEMEALTATSIALLTIYDMCKAVDRGMVMGEIKLLEKQGGKSGHWVA